MAVHTRNRPAVPLEACERIALYCGRHAREALDFASEVIAERRRSGCGWFDAIEVIRHEHGIDEYGMPEVHVEILKALASSGPFSKHALKDIALCEAEELEEYVLPAMRRGGLLQMMSRGVWLTTAGLAELEKRGIHHEGRRPEPGAGR